ncbi:MAG: ATP-dependent Clp protease ATP-binding subunit [Candidatus Falkowbacteria bacterium]|nr:ATP-dependent Clp protease ATP-binding subunit [Candidatus Falkowbacteria bacterium]
MKEKNNYQQEREDWFGGRPLVCQYESRLDLIGISRLKKRLLNLIDFLFAAFSVIGILTLLLWFYFERQGFIENPSNILFFWARQHPLLAVFSFSLFADLFLIYRRSEKRAANVKINYQNWFEKDLVREELLAPSVDNKVKDLEVTKGFSDESIFYLDEAYLLTRKLKQSQVRPIHLFRVLLKNKKIQSIFVRLNVDAKALLEKIDRHVSEGESSKDKIIFSQELLSSLVVAFQNSALGHKVAVDILEILALLPENDQILTEILFDLEIPAEKLENTVAWFQINELLAENYRNFQHLARFKPDSGMNRSFTAIATPTLNNFSHDLTLAAKYGYLEMCVAREDEFAQIFENIGGGRGGILLVGHPGVGKRTMLEGLAQLMVKEEVPSSLSDKRLVELDLSRLIAGASASEAEERLLSCIYEASSAGNIILAIQNIENIIGLSTGSEGSMDLSEVLGEALSCNQIICLATISQENYRKHLEGKALDEALVKININEPEENRAILVLESKVAFLEQKYKIYFLYEAIEQAVKMSDKYLHDLFLPLKAINILQDAAVIAAKNTLRGASSFCGREEVAAAISAFTGIPTSKVTENEGEKLLGLEEEIHQRVIGQEEAVSMIASSLRRARLELKDHNRPMASFLFLGPTGVGKTELAKAVAEVYFGGEEFIVRIDMSEYQYSDSVKKMIGDESGVVGYLTEAVRKKPFSLVLFDEVEKAHPDILNLFLQLMDDGRLTDGQGRTINFKDSIVIATSNIGALYIQEMLNKNSSMEEIKSGLVGGQLNQYMRPELVNRFDGIIVFKPLSEDNLFRITKLLLSKIKDQLAEKGIDFRADKEGALKLAKDAYDPKFGARPLRRLLQERIEDKVATMILSGALHRRDTVVVDSTGDLGIEKGRSL